MVETFQRISKLTLPSFIFHYDVVAKLKNNLNYIMVVKTHKNVIYFVPDR